MNNDVRYFDIHTRAAGYLNRVRKVTPEHGGSPYWAVTVCALRGRPNDDGKYQRTYFDCNVVGDLAVKRLQELKELVDNEHPVFVQVKIGDIEPQSFESKGKTHLCIKGRLLQINSAKVEGEVFEFEAQPENAEQDSYDAQASTQNKSVEQSNVVNLNNEEQSQLSLPEVVKLEKSDPDFHAKKAKLKEQGYRFDRKELVWRLAA